MGCLHAPGSIAAQIGVSQVIDINNDDIGGGGYGSFSGRMAGTQQEKEQDGRKA
jgi:hypothetical protein